jgi:hypothetical protein
MRGVLLSYSLAETPFLTFSNHHFGELTITAGRSDNHYTMHVFLSVCVRVVLFGVWIGGCINWHCMTCGAFDGWAKEIVSFRQGYTLGLE